MATIKGRLAEGIKDVEIHGDYAAFWGSIFSNFYPCNIYIDNRWFKCVEQYFMYEKAMRFNDTETAEKIMKETDPKKIKKLGREVKNYNDEEWSKVRFDIMMNGVYAKFSTNPVCLLAILNEKFEGKSFVEGNPYDKIWSCGLDYRDSQIENKENWQGNNFLGLILDGVRSKLENEDFKYCHALFGSIG